MCAERIAPRDRRAALRNAVAALKVFPLHGVAVLPGTPAPFHIFEERYKALVGDALVGDRILAVPALVSKEGAHQLRPPLRPICGAGIIESEDRYPDGRYDIVVRGLARVRLVEELPAAGARGYREFRAEILDEIFPAGGPAALEGELEALRQIVYELSQKLPKESGAPQLAEAVAQMKDPSAIVDLVAAAAVSDAETRQEVLEQLDVARRLEMVIEEVAGVVLVLGKGRGPKV
jgi:Lon protease-like protein